MNKLLDALASAGVSLSELAKAQSYKDKFGGRIERILVNMGVMAEDSLADVYASVLDVAVIESLDLVDWVPSDEVLNFRELRYLLSRGWTPYQKLSSERWIFLSMSPLDAEVRDFLRWSYPLIELKIVSKSTFNEVVALHFESVDNSTIENLALNQNEEQRLREVASEAPVINLLNGFISKAVEEAASDIHIEPLAGRAKARFRIDGVLRDREGIPESLHLPLVSRIKILAGMDISERRRPQDGKFEVRVAGFSLDIRASVLPLDDGESVVLRLLRQDSLDLTDGLLELLPDVAQKISEDLEKTSGVILMTGPTGSGKTTTLYSFLQRVNKPGVKIITLEDPVEYRVPGLNQVQVKSEIGFDFKAGLRSVVRQDPDVIMVGEIRDGETSQIALQAALTGHLVFSTVHTNDAPSAFTRLLDLGVPEYLLNAALTSVLAQRLVRRVCHFCAEPTTLTGELDESYKLTDLSARYNNGNVRLVDAKGCPECGGSGFQGRMPIIEYLRVDESVRSMAKDDRFLSVARDYNNQQGGRTLLEDGFVRAIRGETTITEVLRVCG